MERVKRLIGYCIIISLTIAMKAEGFEGSITFVKETFYDTSYMICYVKGNLIRLEELNSKKQIINIFLVDEQKESILLINPEKKLYSKLNQKATIKSCCDKFVIQKTDISKVINGELCYQWRVKCKESNSEISYWVMQTNFHFFEKFVHIFGDTENNWRFFSQIPDSQGYFPMLCIERNLVRDEKQRTWVSKINHQQVNDRMFQVPNDYKPFNF